MGGHRAGCFSSCGGCLLWLVIAVLLADGWLGASWAWRVVELVSLVVVGIVALAVRAQRSGGKA